MSESTSDPALPRPDGPNGQRERLLLKFGTEAPKPDEAPGKLPLIAIRDIPEISEQTWLVDGLIPTFEEGAAGYVFGAPKVRKSLLLAEIALSVASGLPVMDVYAVKRTGAAVGFFAEDPKSETSRRVHRLARGKGIDVPATLHLIDVTGLAIDKPDQQTALANTLRSVTDLALVWLDPMVRLHSINDNHAHELGPIHTFLRGLSRSLPGVVFILAHHTNHSGGARGSTDYGAFGDFNLYLESQDDLTTRVRKLENRGGPPGKPFTFRIEDLAVDGERAMRLAVGQGNCEAAKADQRGHVADAIMSFQRSHPGVSQRKAMAQLRDDGLHFGSDRFSAIWKRRP